jgi:phenylacetate-CoA ligase
MSFLSHLPAGTVRTLRRWMLAQGRKMAPARMLALSRQRASRAAAWAARDSAAYRQLLAEQGLSPQQAGESGEWERLPVLTKASTFGLFSVDELARPVPAAALADVLTSSGRGGRSYGFRLTAREQHEDAWFDIDLGLQDVFGVDGKPTLLVNCLPMGVVFASRAVTVANVSVREDMACSILRDIGPRFAQTLVCTDPLFVRALLDEGRAAGVNWAALNTSVIVGEEVLVESQRDHIASHMGISLDAALGDGGGRLVGSSYGVGELGLNLLFETRETIRMRRALREQPALARLVGGSQQGLAVPSLFCFNPLRCFLEVVAPDDEGFGELCITMLDRHAVIRLPRYATGDLARLLSVQEIRHAAHAAGTTEPWLPVVALKGRIKDRQPGGPSVECIKELLYRERDLVDRLSGAFRLEREADGTTRVWLQAASEPVAMADDGQLAARFTALAARSGMGELRFDLLSPSAFPWRPRLDYERKFAYVE